MSDIIPRNFLFKLHRYVKYKGKEFNRLYLTPFFYKISVFSKKSLSPVIVYDVVIIDDMLPNILSAFRAFEFAFLLKNINNISLYSIIQNKKEARFKYANSNFFIDGTDKFSQYKKEFSENFNLDAGKIHPFYEWTKLRSKLAYVVFLHNAFNLIEYLEKYKIKFILELYPGGGFTLNKEGKPFEQLKRVLRSDSFAHVIVTQKVSMRFLLDNNLCLPEQVSFRYWGVGADKFDNIPEKKIKYKTNKNTIDICFTAAKYSEKGLDKGYDIFIDMAHILLKKNIDFYFHIVGGFTKDDIKIDEGFLSHFYFYDYLKTGDFITYYENKDIFISPNRPDVLAPGAFDGFPTGSCAEAGKNGLCMILSDPLNCNILFENHEDAILVENDADQISTEVLKLAQAPDEIYRIGENGKKAFRKINPQEQLDYRLSLINKYI